MVVQWLAQLPHSKRVQGLKPPLCVEFTCSPWAYVGFLQGTPASSHNPKVMQVRFISDFKLPIGVSVRGLSVCLSTCRPCD